MNFHFFFLQGAFVGLLSGFVVSLWVGIGAQIYPPLPERTMPLKLRTIGCETEPLGNWTATMAMPILTTLSHAPVIERYTTMLACEA